MKKCEWETTSKEIDPHEFHIKPSLLGGKQRSALVFLKTQPMPPWISRDWFSTEFVSGIGTVLDKHTTEHYKPFGMSCFMAYSPDYFTGGGYEAGGLVRKFASSGKGLKMRVPMGVFRCIVFWAVLVFANLPSIAFAESLCPGIHVKVLNIKNSTGNVACALFESPVGFPAEYLRFATTIMVIKVRHRQARCDFAGIAPGTYALAVVHDENSNCKLDTNRLGIPTEGYGFSNDATALLGPPSFAAASFLYNGKNLDLTVSLHY